MRPTILALLVLATVASAGEAVVLDRVTYKDKSMRECVVMSETGDEMKYLNRPGDAPETVKASKAKDISGIAYAFQRGESAWTAGVAARDAGLLPKAIEQFVELGKGAREAEKIVGAFEEGATQEMAGDFAAAAAAFKRIVEGFPSHPLIIDTQYRLGVVLAQAKQPAEAETLAKKFDELAKGRLGQQANVRGAAIRAAVAMVAGSDERAVRNHLAKAAFNAATERSSWLHFNLFMADAYRAQGKNRDALGIYERMLQPLGADAAAAVRVRIGLGLSRGEGERQAAILDLLPVDALPFGSADQKCVARYNLGRLMLAEAEAAKKDPATAGDERKSAFVQENLKTARLFLQAAAGSTSTDAAKGQAEALLKTLN